MVWYCMVRYGYVCQLYVNVCMLCVYKYIYIEREGEICMGRGLSQTKLATALSRLASTKNGEICCRYNVRTVAAPSHQLCWNKEEHDSPRCSLDAVCVQPTTCDYFQAPPSFAPSPTLASEVQNLKGGSCCQTAGVRMVQDPGPLNPWSIR